MRRDPIPKKTPEALQVLIESLHGDDVATAAYADWLEEQGRPDLAGVWREESRRQRGVKPRTLTG